MPGALKVGIACSLPTGLIACAGTLLVLEPVQGRGQLLRVEPGSLERAAAPAMGQGQASQAGDVAVGRLDPALEGGEGLGAPGQDDVGPQPLGPQLGAQASGQRQHPVGQGHVGEDVGARGQGGGDLALLGFVAGGEAGRVGVVGQTPADRLGPQLRLGRGPDLHGQPEPVEELGSQLALLGVHRPHQHEAGLLLHGEAVALHPVDAEGGGVDEQVDEMVGQQVHLVDVQHAPVGRGQ